MKKKLLLPLLALAGCTPTTTPEAPAAAAPAEASCQTEGLSDLVGKPASAELAAQAMQRSGARSTRTIGPDSAVTMDYRVDRLNIHIDAAGVITHFRCG